MLHIDTRIQCSAFASVTASLDSHGVGRFSCRSWSRPLPGRALLRTEAIVDDKVSHKAGEPRAKQGPHLLFPPLPSPAPSRSMMPSVAPPPPNSPNPASLPIEALSKSWKALLPPPPPLLRFYRATDALATSTKVVEILSLFWPAICAL